MNSNDTLQRSILPIPDSQHVGVTTYDAKDPGTKFPPIQSLRPPKGAPNVLIVLLDDVGFAASSAFGGPIHTPTAERLAKSVSGPVELLMVENGGHNANNRPYRYRSRSADWLAAQFDLPKI